MISWIHGQSAYYDTNSMVYIDNGTKTVDMGCMVGELSDELSMNNHINDWISTGPKGPNNR